ncbi:CopM family metallochaperone [Pararhizobium gei]|uniref:CopM family metallochaperone n=1 Tax=Pararhizobium gei TaxID=1395951 RepID=UPI0023DCB3A9|nr:DUF305 domain-containing protein [Rhizobium gei]
MSLRTITAAAILAASFTLPASAQEMNHDAMDHGTMNQGAMSAEPKGDRGPSSKAFAAANAKMHGAMDIAYTGNADMDFVRGMIAHHQGAIDMAKIELEFGKDAQLRKLAEEVISAQEAEIKTMKAWLAENGG